MINPNFYDHQATLDQSRACYIERQADRDLLAAVTEGTYALLLASRKMGKSSLIERAFERLKGQGYLVARKELAVGQQTADQWCYTLARDLVSDAGTRCSFVADTAWEEWWRKQDLLAPVERFFAFLREFLLSRTGKSWVIAIDEIETTIKLAFGDDFFARLRSCATGKAGDPVLRRLTFILAGVTTPSELIKDSSRTPFNIGRVISIRDFSPAEASCLLPGLGQAPDPNSSPLEAILRWTDGHPYLTQRLFKEVATTLLDRGVEEAAQVADWEGEVAAVVHQRYFRPRIRREEEHFADISERRLKECKRQGTARGFLLRYRRVLRGLTVPDEPLSLPMTHLKLTGLVKVAEDGNRLVTRSIARSSTRLGWTAKWPAMPRPTAVPF